MTNNNALKLHTAYDSLRQRLSRYVMFLELINCRRFLSSQIHSFIPACA